jgi:hypothetical protein
MTRDDVDTDLIFLAAVVALIGGIDRCLPKEASTILLLLISILGIFLAVRILKKAFKHNQ